jgi:hypothetical protein
LLQSARTKVLINGSAGMPFSHGKGLRQGDPISPLLFVIAMDVLSALFRAAENAGVLTGLSAMGHRHRVSLYADDVVIFARPVEAEVQVVRGILDFFGGASGLRVNYGKSSIVPIHCSEEALESVALSLPCPVTSMPCTYLGLPLAIRKLQRSDLLPVVDKLASKLSAWKARLLTLEGRATYVQVVMTASIIYQLMALDLEPWFLEAVDKLRRGFLWAGAGDAHGGHCAVAWDRVCQPKCLGGLGFHNLRLFNTALRSKLLWLSRTDASKPWHGLNVDVGEASKALFQASVVVTIGAGTSANFWEDPWIGGLTAESIAPSLFLLVRPAARPKRTIAEGLLGHAWASDIVGELTLDALTGYLKLWRAI